MWIYLCTIPGFSPGSLWPVLNYKQRSEPDELPDGTISCHHHGQRSSQEGRCGQLGRESQQGSGCEGRTKDGQTFCCHRVPHSNRGGEWPSGIAVVTVVVTFVCN